MFTKNFQPFPDQAINNSASDDELDISALDAFCHNIKNEPDLCSAAARLIAGKIQSLNVKESLLALDALEGNQIAVLSFRSSIILWFILSPAECMDTLGLNFQLEVNKFKFLNELVRRSFFIAPSKWVKSII